MIEKVTKIIKEEKSLIKNSSIIFFSTVVGGILAMITTFTLSRIFGPHNFGIFKTITAFFGLFIYFFDFGFQNTLIKYISRYSSIGRKNKIKELIQNLFFFRLIILIPIIILSLLFKDNIAQILLKNKDLGYLIYPGLFLLVLTFSDLTRPIIIGLQNFKLISIVNIGIPATSLVIIIPTALYLGLPAAIIGLGIAHLTGSLISYGFILNKKYHIRPGKSVFKFPKLIMSYGLPSYFSSIPSFLFLGIIPILSPFFTQTEIGYYAFALAFYTAAMIVPISINHILFPKVSSYSEKDIHKASSTLKNALLLHGIAAGIEIIAVFLLAKKFISIISPLFLPAVPLVLILVTASSILGFGSLLIAYFTARKKLKIAFLLNIVASATFIVISYSALKFTI